MTAVTATRLIAVAVLMLLAAREEAQAAQLTLGVAAPKPAAAAPPAASEAPVPLAQKAEPQPAMAEPPAPAAAPRMKVITLDTSAAMRRTPEPGLAMADVPVASVIKVPLHKTRPMDLPGNVAEIVVGAPDIADVLVRAPNQVYLMAKAAGDTNIFFLDRDGKLVQRVEVNVHTDVETLRSVLSQLLPDENIELTAFGDTITLSGTVRNDAASKNARAIARRFVGTDQSIINMIKVAGEQQVLLRVRLAEVSKNVLKEINARVSYAGDTIGNLSIGASSAGGSNVVGALGTLALSSTTFPISLNLQALENEGLVKTLAEPTLTALSGEEARVLSGGEYPITAVQNSTTGAVTVEYRDFGVALTFVPVIVGPGRISLKMASEVSAISGVGNFGFPILSVRRAVTAVEMPSGGSMMVAGVLTHDMVSSMDGVPGLMDVPVLGALFRSSSFQRQESELVVTVEAYIVEPTVPKKIIAPSDGFAAASDLDRYLLGRLHKVYAKPALPANGEPLQGPFGYIIQ